MPLTAATTPLTIFITIPELKSLLGEANYFQAFSLTGDTLLVLFRVGLRWHFFRLSQMMRASHDERSVKEDKFFLRNLFSLLTQITTSIFLSKETESGTFSRWSALREKIGVSRKFSAQEIQRLAPKQISVHPLRLPRSATASAVPHRLQVQGTD